MDVILAVCAGVLLGAWAMAVLARSRLRELERMLVDAARERSFVLNRLDQSYRARQALAAQLRAAESALQRQKEGVRQ